MKNKKGFTLAEVLVTLAVIGIVAALTIPSLIQSSAERQAKTSIRKALSMLNQALSMSIAENNAGAASATSLTTLTNTFAPFMSTIDEDLANGMITTTDGMIYTFDYVANCPSATDNDAVLSTHCLVEVDINGESGNEVPGLTTGYTDLYYFIVTDQSVSPANELSATPTAHGNFRSTGTNVPDNVALDALLN